MDITNHFKNSSAEPAKLALIGFRYDENSSFMKGAADAPPQIRGAFRSDASNSLERRSGPGRRRNVLRRR